VYRPKGLDEVLPWDFIDHGILKGHLIKEYELALKGMLPLRSMSQSERVKRNKEFGVF